MIDYPAEDTPTQAVISELTTPQGLRVALVTLTNGDDRRPATMGPIGLSNLDTALDAIVNDGGFAGAVITGVGRTFCAGANLDTLSTPPDVDAALALAREGHRVFGRLSQLGVPTVAALSGTALGGGLELALHCTHRVALTGSGPYGLPEVGLGLIPGWGGATLLPRIIGLETALTVMMDNAIQGRTLNAETAHSFGIIDSVSDDVLRLALDVIDKEPMPKSAEELLESDWTDAVVQRVTKLSGRPGNPLVALDRLRDILVDGRDSSIADGFAREDDALSELMMTAEFRRRLYAFRVTSAANKPPVGTPDVEPLPIHRVGVVGAGLMASQIALAFAETLRLPVVMTDVDDARLAAARERLEGWLAARVSKGTLDSGTADSILDQIETTLDFADFESCDLVIEAVFEDLAVKKDVLQRLEKVVRSDTILASNTSSLSIDAMASFLDRPERMAGIHFFNPIAAMKLVEVVCAPTESNVTLATAIDVTRRLRKTPVLVSDRAGFVVNRILSMFLGEVLRLVSDGASVDAISAALSPMRLPMTPFQLIDLIGRTVTLKMMQSLEQSGPERFFVGDALVALTANPLSDSIASDLASQEITARDVTAAAIHDHITDALAREIRIMLTEGVVAGAREIDLCMINGAGWPAAIGGVTPYLDGCGASVRSGAGRFHPAANFA